MDATPTPSSRPTQAAPPSRLAPAAWVCLDWAASAFSTVLITLIVAYVERIVFAGKAWGVPAGVVWAWTLASAMLVSAVVAPWLAAWADRARAHQWTLVASVVVGSGALVALAAVPPTARLAVAACIVVACVAFDVGGVFTGSLLPRIAVGPAADRLSAFGFAAGYAGGGIALIAATLLVAAREQLGLSAAGGLRVAFCLTGAWWLFFSLPAAFVRFGDGSPESHAGSSGRELRDFAAALLRPTAGGGRQPLATVLAGAVLTLGAVQTAISQFSSVALEQFHLDGPGLVRLVLLVQAVALPGALAMGWISTRLGRRAATTLCLVGWIAVLVLSWFVRTVPELYRLAAVLALVLGGIQSVIRASVAGLAPRGRFGATFGLLQVGTKLCGCLASLAFGAIYQISGDPRAGLVAILAQLLAAWWILRRAPAH